MNNVPQKLRNKWNQDRLDGKVPVCCRASEGDCSGRMTKEHALYFKGSQIQMEFAIIDLCAFHHSVDEYQDGGGLDKQKNVWIALNRGSDEELKGISKNINYIRERERLNAIYGVWEGLEESEIIYDYS